MCCTSPLCFLLGLLPDLQWPQPQRRFRRKPTKTNHLTTWWCIFCMKTWGHYARGWNNVVLQLQDAWLPPEHIPGTSLPPFLVESWAWHMEGTGLGLRGSRLHFWDLPLFPSQQLKPTPLPLSSSSLLGPDMTFQACGPFLFSGHRHWSPLSIHQSTRSAGGLSSPPSTPSSEHAGQTEHHFCRLLADGWAEASAPAPCISFSLHVTSSSKVNFTLRIIYRLPASDCP